MTTYELPLPWSKPPLSLNHRRGWRANAALVKEVRHAGWALARSSGVGPHERVRVELHYRPRDRRTRDDENPVPTLKALADGLVDAGVVVGDTKVNMVKEMPIIHEPVKGSPGCMWLIIEVLDSAVAS